MFVHQLDWSEVGVNCSIPQVIQLHITNFIFLWALNL